MTKRKKIIISTITILIILIFASLTLIPKIKCLYGQEITINFKPTLKDSASRLLREGKPFSSALVDGSTYIDELNKKYGVCGAYSAAFSRDDLNTKDAQALFDKTNINNKNSKYNPVGMYNFIFSKKINTDEVISKYLKDSNVVDVYIPTYMLFKKKVSLFENVILKIGSFFGHEYESSRIDI